MSENTVNLDLLKKDTVTDANDSFNIDTMLNDNWDKIDIFAGDVNEFISGGMPNKQDKFSFPLTKTAGYHIQNNEWVLVDSTGGAVVITLPEISAESEGLNQKVRVGWIAGSNPVTVTDGTFSYEMVVLTESEDFEGYAGDEWRIV